MDAYHRSTLCLSQVGVFAYVIPPAADSDCVIVCIDLVLPIIWVDSPKFFCALLETLVGVVNDLVHTSVPVLGYSAIAKIPETNLGPPHTLDSLTHIYCYMDDVITSVQGCPKRTTPSLLRHFPGPQMTLPILARRNKGFS